MKNKLILAIAFSVGMAVKAAAAVDIPVVDVDNPNYPVGTYSCQDSSVPKNGFVMLSDGQVLSFEGENLYGDGKFLKLGTSFGHDLIKIDYQNQVSSLVITEKTIHGRGGRGGRFGGDPITYTSAKLKTYEKEYYFWCL